MRVFSSSPISRFSTVSEIRFHPLSPGLASKPLCAVPVGDLGAARGSDGAGVSAHTALPPPAITLPPP